jgi:hypothetical protein
VVNVVDLCRSCIVLHGMKGFKIVQNVLNKLLWSAMILRREDWSQHEDDDDILLGFGAV